MVTFEEAREIARDALRDEFGPEMPPFVAEWGGESDEWWEVPVGTKEWLVEFNEDFQIFDSTVYLVNKDTGHFRCAHCIIDGEFLSSFRPYGDVPSFFRDEDDSSKGHA